MDPFSVRRFNGFGPNGSGPLLLARTELTALALWLIVSVCQARNVVGLIRLLVTALTLAHGAVESAGMVGDREIAAAAEAIRQGRVVAFPTETVYGLGANALNSEAVAKIFELKGRPRFDPLIVHLADRENVFDLVTAIPDSARLLMERFWPGPLSVVMPKQECIPDIVTAGLSSVALRCPSHPVAQRLLQSAAVPIAAPSANLFSAVSPTTAQHVQSQFAGRVEHILDGGPCQVGVESTVVAFLEDQPVLLRPGGVTREEIEEVIGKLEIAKEEGSAVISPGQLPKHYSPSTPLVLTHSAHPPESGSKVGLLSFGVPASSDGYVAVEVLSQKECLREAAANLFAAIRRLDALSLDQIHATPVPESGLGLAIMDRLRRAAAK